MIPHTKKFCASLSVRVSDSRQPVKCVRKYCKNSLGHNLHSYTTACSTRHHTLLHTHMIQDTKTFIAPAYYLRHKISYEANLPQSALLHPHTLHMPSYTSKYSNIYAPDRFNSKIDSIESDHFTLGRTRKNRSTHKSKSDHYPFVWIKNKSIQTQIQVRSFSSWLN